MASNRFCHLVLFFLLAGLASSTFILNDAFESRGLTGRNLLQQKAGCPVNFENQNYTIITSQCKGPQYNAKVCCDAFKQLSCPYSEQINDLKTDCASTLFSYINLYGKYPPGLFSSLCRDGKDGLDCEETLKTQAKASVEKSGASAKCTQPLMLMLTSAFLMLLFKLL